MSLGKLLTTGKSLMGLHNSNARYRLAKGALPKFESAKNPFVCRSTVGASIPVLEREPQLPKLTQEEIVAANLKETQRMPECNSPAVAAPVAAPVAAVAQSPQIASAPTAADSWLKRMNPMAWWEKRRPVAAKPLTQRFSKVPVQGKLSLDNIKVMRNDLSETDMEVVRAKARTPVVQSAAKEPVAALPAPELPAAKKALDFLNERLVGKH